MHISLKPTKPQHPDLYLNNIKLKVVESHTHLGITFNDSMTWTNHIDKIAAKAMSRVHTLKRIRYNIPKMTALTIYKSLVRPVMEYGDVLFDNMPLFLCIKLDKIQREAMITIIRAFRITSTSALESELSLESLSIRRKMHRLILYFKMLNGLTPPYLKNLLPLQQAPRDRYLLRERGIPVPLSRIVRYRKSFIVQTTRDWNILHTRLKDIKEISRFKVEMKSYFYISKPNKLLFFGNEPASIHHSRMRLGISHINAQLFHYIKVVNPDCPHCPNIPENLEHFFLICPHHIQQRNAMLQRLHTLQNANDIEITSLPSKLKIKLFLQGDPKLNFTLNSAIFIEVQRFIESTKRFKPKSNS